MGCVLGWWPFEESWGGAGVEEERFERKVGEGSEGGRGDALWEERNGEDGDGEGGESCGLFGRGDGERLEGEEGERDGGVECGVGSICRGLTRNRVSSATRQNERGHTMLRMRVRTRG